VKAIRELRVDTIDDSMAVQMFECIDSAIHPQDSDRQLRSMEVAAAVLVNCKKSIPGYQADQAIVLHQELKKR